MSHQRVLSSSSMMLTKGVAMKSGDWPSNASLDEMRFTSHPSMTSLGSTASSAQKMSISSSSSSFHKFMPISSSLNQFDLRRLSSASVGSLNSPKPRHVSSSSMGNATWDDLSSASLTSVSNIFDLKKMKDSEFGLERKSSDQGFLHGSSAKSSSPLKHGSLGRSNLIPLEEDNSSFSDCEFVVKTFREKEPEQIDARSMTLSKLASLKENDAFMYYSIPEVKKANMEGKDVNLKSLAGSEKKFVKRCSAISFESAPPIMLDGMDIPGIGESFYSAIGDDGPDWEEEFLNSFMDDYLSNQ